MKDGPVDWVFINSIFDRERIMCQKAPAFTMDPTHQGVRLIKKNNFYFDGVIEVDIMKTISGGLVGVVFRYYDSGYFRIHLTKNQIFLKKVHGD